MRLILHVRTEDTQAVVVNARHDVVGQDPLLLPPGFAVTPDTTVVFFALESTFHHVVQPPRWLSQPAQGWHQRSGERRFCSFPSLQAVHPGEIPALQIVTNNTAGLVNTPLQIVCPIFVKLLIHEGAVAVIREVLTNQVKSVFEELSISLVTCSKV